MALHRQVVAVLLCDLGTAALEQRVETLEVSPTSRRASSTGSSATSTTAPAAAGHAHDRPRAWPASGSTPTPARQGARPRGPGAGPPGARRDPRPRRGIAPSILLDRGLVAALESIAGRGPVPTSIRSELAPGERLPVPPSGPPTSSPRRRSRTSPSTAAPRAARCSCAATVAGSSSRSATTAPAARRRPPAAGWPGWPAGSPASTGRSRCRAPSAARPWSGRDPAAVHRRRSGPLRRSRRTGRAAAPSLGPGAARQTEVGQHRQHPAVVVLRVGQLELAEDVADVLLGRPLGDPEQPRRSRCSFVPRPSPPAPRARAASGSPAGRRRGAGPSAGRRPRRRAPSRRGRPVAARP